MKYLLVGEDALADANNDEALGDTGVGVGETAFSSPFEVSGLVSVLGSADFSGSPTQKYNMGLCNKCLL